LEGNTKRLSCPLNITRVKVVPLKGKDIPSCVNIAFVCTTNELEREYLSLYGLYLKLLLTPKG